MSKKTMTLNEALHILMRAAANDARGSGLGYRSTSDAWRLQLAQAWAVAHKRVYGRAPDGSAYRNAGLPVPDEFAD